MFITRTCSHDDIFETNMINLDSNSKCLRKKKKERKKQRKNVFVKRILDFKCIQNFSVNLQFIAWGRSGICELE